MYLHVREVQNPCLCYESSIGPISPLSTIYTYKLEITASKGSSVFFCVSAKALRYNMFIIHV